MKSQMLRYSAAKEFAAWKSFAETDKVKYYAIDRMKPEKETLSQQTNKPDN